MATLDKIKVGGVDYDIVDSQARADIETLKKGEVDAYTKGETDNLLKGKQDKMSGNYLSKVDVGGSSISIETKAFADESVQKTDTINFKTINNNPIFGMGNIEIEGGSSAKEWTVADITKATNTELPFKEVNVGDVVKTTSGNFVNYYSIVSKVDSNETWDTGILSLINSKEKLLVTLSISLGTLDQPWGNTYLYLSTNIGGTNITVQSDTHGSSANYIYSEGYSASTKNAISTLWVEQFGVDNGVRINSTLWGGDAVGVPVEIQCATPWGMNGVMSSTDKSKLDSIDMGGIKLKKITQSEYDGLTNKDENTLYIING